MQPAARQQTDNTMLSGWGWKTNALAYLYAHHPHRPLSHHVSGMFREARQTSTFDPWKTLPHEEEPRLAESICAEDTDSVTEIPRALFCFTQTYHKKIGKDRMKRNVLLLRFFHPHVNRLYNLLSVWRLTANKSNCRNNRKQCSQPLERRQIGVETCEWLRLVWWAVRNSVKMRLVLQQRLRFIDYRTSGTNKQRPVKMKNHTGAQHSVPQKSRPLRNLWPLREPVFTAVYLRGELYLQAETYSSCIHWKKRSRF